jgi:hypothetical protein
MPKLMFEHELSQEHKDQLEKAKRFIQRNWKPFVVGIGFAGITYAITRGVSSQSIGRGIVPVAAQGGNVAVLGKKAVMSNVSFISSYRQGSPSWVVRCLETDEIFTSQRKAAIVMGLTPYHLSQHLNHMRDNVKGFHFERICLAG